MFSKILLMCCLWFHFNGMLSVEGLSATTLLNLDDIINSDIVVEGVFVADITYYRYNKPDYIQDFGEGSAQCAAYYSRPGMNVTLLQNIDYLSQLASQEDDFCYDTGKKCSKRQNEGYCEDHADQMYYECREKCGLCQETHLIRSTYRIGLRKLGDTETGVWTWEDGSTLPVGDSAWDGEFGDWAFCAGWYAGSNYTNFGHIQALSCKDVTTASICQISDIDECAADVNPCGDDECFNTVGGYHCACDAGYESVNGICTDVNECEQSPPPCVECVNTEGGYECLNEDVDVEVYLEAGTMDVFGVKNPVLEQYADDILSH